MSFEGTGKYFIMLFITYIIIVLVVKISLSTLFEKANIKGWKAFVPIDFISFNLATHSSIPKLSSIDSISSCLRITVSYCLTILALSVIVP